MTLWYLHNQPWYATWKVTWLRIARDTTDIDTFRKLSWRKRWVVQISVEKCARKRTWGGILQTQDSTIGAETSTFLSLAENYLSHDLQTFFERIIVLWTLWMYAAPFTWLFKSCDKPPPCHFWLWEQLEQHLITIMTSCRLFKCYGQISFKSRLHIGGFEKKHPHAR